MSNASRTAVLSTRVPLETRARFSALAARHQLSESALLQKLIGVVLADNTPKAVEGAPPLSSVAPADGDLQADRITLRLRQGDRARVVARANARGVKAGTYLALLIHNHANAVDVMPPDEINHLKASTARLAALGRELRMFFVPNTSSDPAVSELRELVGRVSHEIEVARAASAAVVRRNYESWEAGHA